MGETVSFQKKKFGDMTRRFITGTTIAVISITLIIWGIIPLTILVLTLAIIGMDEFVQLAYRQKIRPSRTMCISGIILILTSAYPGKEEYMSGVLMGMSLIVMLFYLFRKGFHVSAFADVGATLMGLIYLGWFFGHMLLLRKLTIPGTSGNYNLFGFSIEQGAGFVLMLLFSTSFTDIGAFFTGKFFGKHKLCPGISPGKTVEGSLGGLIGAVCGAALIGHQLPIAMNDYINLGILIGIFGELGDLWESVLKRDVNVKDSGVIMAGHGGVLDRIDSILFTTPVAFFYIKYFIL